ncbi:hypothetical protein BVY02_01360, partial [bacterium J17]
DILLDRDFSLTSLVQCHRDSRLNPVATMVLREDENSSSYGEISVDEDGQVVGFLGDHYSENPGVRNLMYLGIQLLTKPFLQFFDEENTVCSVTRDVYPKVLAAGLPVDSYIFSGYWCDVGTLERLSKVQGESDILPIR